MANVTHRFDLYVIPATQPAAVQVFGNVTHILPGGEHEGTLDHMDFYLFAMRALAGRKPVQTMFTVDDKIQLSMVSFCPSLFLLLSGSWNIPPSAAFATHLRQAVAHSGSSPQVGALPGRRVPLCAGTLLGWFEEGVHASE